MPPIAAEAPYADERRYAADACHYATGFSLCRLPLVRHFGHFFRFRYYWYYGHSYAFID
jgi:hypothetical protein